MKKYVIAGGLCVAVLVCASGARAEVPDKNGAVPIITAAKPHRVYNPAVNFSRFIKDLALTPEQQKKIKPLLEDLEKQLLPLNKLTFQRKGQRGAPIVKEYYQKVGECLETEQLEKFNDMVAKGEITPFTR